MLAYIEAAHLYQIEWLEDSIGFASGCREFIPLATESHIERRAHQLFQEKEWDHEWKEDLIDLAKAAAGILIPLPSNYIIYGLR